MPSDKAPLLSVVICTHNPRWDYLRATLEALSNQSLPHTDWELIVVDNGSTSPLPPIDLPNSRIVKEPRIGLTHARLRGFSEASAPIIVMVDDDNVLGSLYLQRSLELMQQHPDWGGLGGRSVGVFEEPPPPWLADLGFELLACRDYGPDLQTASWKDADWTRRYPPFAPIGAGYVLRREIAEAYANLVKADPVRAALDRRGNDLASGGDNDITLEALRLGWRVAYSPELRLEHFIPTQRLRLDYQCRLYFAANRTWMILNSLHGINPWPPIPAWSYRLRALKAWFRFRAWAGPAQRVRWYAACGHFAGRVAAASLPRPL
jgi:glycosyltransferase involved in cell wall biosynthesis